MTPEEFDALPIGDVITFRRTDGSALGPWKYRRLDRRDWEQLEPRKAMTRHDVLRIALQKKRWIVELEPPPPPSADEIRQAIASIQESARTCADA